MITGTGSGLGLGLAVRLLKRGSKVSVLDLSVNDEHRAALDDAARLGNGRWQFIEANVTQEEQVRVAVAQAVNDFGAPDLAVNSAGVGLCQAFADMSSEAFRRVIDINLMGSYNFAAAVLPHLKKGARLALVASLAGITSNYAYAAYGTSKFGVVGLATTLRYEYEPRGIHISCICPPEVKTPLVAQERGRRSGGAGPQAHRGLDGSRSGMRPDPGRTRCRTLANHSELCRQGHGLRGAAHAGHLLPVHERADPQVHAQARSPRRLSGPVSDLRAVVDRVSAFIQRRQMTRGRVRL